MANDDERDAIRALDPTERRLVLVATEATHDALARAIDWRKAGTSLGAALALGPIFSTAVASTVVIGAAAAGPERVRQGLASAKDAFDRAIRRGAVPFPRIEPSLARALFRFSAGEPRDGTVYVLHPSEPDRYLLPATATVELAREKIALFANVAARLGARRIVLVGAETSASRAGGGVRVPIPKLALALGLDVASWRSDGSERHVVREYGPPAAPVSYPDELRVAIEADPDVRGLARERLEHRLLRARTTFAFREEAGVGPELVAELAAKGLRVGASDVKHVASSWTFEVEFWPND